MRKRRIRPLAICVFRNRGRILVAEGWDESKNQAFYRPIGGAIEFGEDSREALTREVREELGAQITDLTLLGVVENRFTYEGEPGHEIVLVYDGRFVDRSLYDRERLDLIEECWRGGIWVSLDDLRAGGPPVYPTGLLNLIEGSMAAE